MQSGRTVQHSDWASRPSCSLTKLAGRAIQYRPKPFGGGSTGSQKAPLRNPLPSPGQHVNRSYLTPSNCLNIACAYIMKIRIYSDLHVEFHRFDPPPLDASIDLVILAGDIDKKARGVRWANDTFNCTTVYVAGNHEFYGGHLDRTLQKTRDAAAPHVHILENQSLVIGDVRVLGTAGWTDFTSTGDQVAASKMARESMNDFTYIRTEASYRRIRPWDIIEKNRTAKQWLTEELAKTHSGKTIVVTHHAPTPAVVGEKHQGHLNAAYTNDWPSLIKKADLWVFGHTHERVDVELAGSRVVSNPRGYPGEVTGFNDAFEIEL